VTRKNHSKSDYNLESFDALESIITRLRAPDGCPWDREQTHTSIKKHLLEECYEALQAIDEEDATALAEELGDLLLEVVLQAQIAKDNGEFTIHDVLRGINSKLIRRHPHVFGDGKASNSDEVLANWDKIKKTEHGDDRSVLEGVPKAMPSLARSQEIQGRAARVGFDWPNIDGVLDKVREEIGEFAEAKSRAELEHEFGDILAALVNVARKTGIDSEAALRKANGRFYDRFTYMEKVCKERGINLADLPLDEQNVLWEEAKSKVDKEASDKAF